MTNSGGLQPLRKGLGPETEALAEELRTLFTGLEISVRRYAAQVPWDTSVVSRYLSGDRVPEWKFVHDLLVRSTEKHNGAPPTQEVVSHLKTLHRAVLSASSAPHLQVIALREELAEASAASKRAARREEDLQAALYVAQRRIAELGVTGRELTDALDRQQAQYSAEIERYRGLMVDREALFAEIRRLTKELMQAHERRQAAEARADDLERRLEQAEHDFQDSERHLTPYPDVVAELVGRRQDGTLSEMSPQQVVAALGYMPPDWGTAVLGALPSGLGTAVLGAMPPERAVAALEPMELEQGATMLGHMEPAQAVMVLSSMDEWRAAEVLNWMEPGRAAEALGSMEPGRAAEVLGSMEPGPAAEVLGCAEPTQAAAMLNSIDQQRAGEVLWRLDDRRAAGVLGCMEPKLAAAMLKLAYGDRPAHMVRVERWKVDQVLTRLEPGRAAEVLRHMEQPWVLRQLEPGRGVGDLGRRDPNWAAAVLNHMKKNGSFELYGGRPR